MDKSSLFLWCRIPAEQLETHPELRVRFRMTADSQQMGKLIADELIDEIMLANRENRACRAIIPCGPKCWYPYFVERVNRDRVSLRNFFVFHMDECLDWQGRLLPKGHPYNFRSCMEAWFYKGIDQALEVPTAQRFFLSPASMETVRREIETAPLDITIGGWGQDGHIAYNQARRNVYSRLSLDELRNAGIRIQENNADTILALSQRTFGAAYQFVPPMSITLGVKECLSAKKVRLFSDTGAWKQTALRVALFSEPTAEYPITLLQEHPDAVITATFETANHPIAQNPQWELDGVKA